MQPATRASLRIKHRCSARVHSLRNCKVCKTVTKFGTYVSRLSCYQLTTFSYHYILISHYNYEIRFQVTYLCGDLRTFFVATRELRMVKCGELRIGLPAHKPLGIVMSWYVSPDEYAVYRMTAAVLERDFEVVNVINTM